MIFQNTHANPYERGNGFKNILICNLLRNDDRIQLQTIEIKNHLSKSFFFDLQFKCRNETRMLRQLKTYVLQMISSLKRRNVAQKKCEKLFFHTNKKLLSIVKIHDTYNSILFYVINS